MGVLKKQNTLKIAVWSSVLLHTAGFLGFELAFSNRKESFPKSEPRTVSILSIGSLSGSEGFPEPETEKNLQDRIPEHSFSETPKPKENVEQNKLQELSNSAESELNSIHSHNQEDEILNIEYGDGGSGAGETQKEVVLVTEPIPLSNIEPEYPFKARKKGFEGIVVLDIIVSKSGEPLSCSIADSSGHKDLDNAAMETVLSAYYEPGTLNGEDIESTLRIRIIFKLHNS